MLKALSAVAPALGRKPPMRRTGAAVQKVEFRHLRNIHGIKPKSLFDSNL